MKCYLEKGFYLFPTIIRIQCGVICQGHSFRSVLPLLYFLNWSDGRREGFFLKKGGYCSSSMFAPLTKCGTSIESVFLALSFLTNKIRTL